MDEPKAAPELEPPALDARFFIDELATYALESDRRYASLSGRLARLERQAKPAEGDLTQYVGGMVLVMLALQFLPVVMDMVRTWRSSSSSSLSASGTCS